MEAIDLARRVVEIASDKQAGGIVLLDTRAVSGFSDYFVICTGDTARQIEAIQGEIEYQLKQQGVLRHHSEGTIDSGWLLIDYGDVIVHIFAPLEREYYQLDSLWSQASTLLNIQ